MEPSAARARFSEAHVARLATVRADGSPHLVPISFALEGDTLYTAVDHKPKRSRELQRLDNIAANPAVCLLVDHYDEDWSQLCGSEPTASRASPGPATPRTPARSSCCARATRSTAARRRSVRHRDRRHPLYRVARARVTPRPSSSGRAACPLRWSASPESASSTRVFAATAVMLPLGS